MADVIITDLHLNIDSFEKQIDDAVKGMDRYDASTVTAAKDTKTFENSLGSATGKLNATKVATEGAAKASEALRNNVSGDFSGKLSEASSEAGAMADSIDEATNNLTKAVFASDQLSKSQRQIRADALAVTDAIATGKVPQEEGLRVLEQLSQEYKENAIELAKVKDAARQIGEGLDTAEAPAKSLKAQFKEAKVELDRLIEASDGQITPELIQAAKKAGELSDRIGDLNATVEAFNPDTKFKALLGVLGNVAGGVQTVTAALGLLGAESDDVNKALLKVQQTTALFQGIQSFIGGLADNWKNLKTVIAASTVATQADTAAKTANAAGSGAVAAGNTAAAGATGVLTGAMNALKAAILSNPITAAGVAIAAFAAAAFAATRDTKDYAASVSGLIAELDELTKRRFTDIDQKARLANIEAERKALEAGESEADKRRASEIKYQNNRAAVVAKRLEFELNMLNLINEVEALRGKTGDSAEQARKQATDKLVEYTEAFQKSTNELQVIDAEFYNERLKNRNADAAENKKTEDKRVDDAKKAAEKSAAEAKKIAESRLAVEQDLAKAEASLLGEREKAEADALSTRNARVEKAAGDADLLRRIETQYQADLQAIQEKAAKDAEAVATKQAQALQSVQLTAMQGRLERLKEEQNIEIDLAKMRGEDLTQLIADQGAERAAIEQQIKDTKLAQLEQQYEDEYAALDGNLIAQTDRLAQYEIEKAELLNEFDTQRIESKKKLLEEEKAIEQARQDTEQASFDFSNNLSGFIKEAGKENLAAQQAALALEKSAAIAQIIVRTSAAKTAIAAQGALLGPIAGPPYVALNTALLLASSATSIGTIIATSIQGFDKGGRVSRGDGAPITRPGGDNVLITAKSGEVILNDKQQKQLVDMTDPSIFGLIGVPGFPRPANSKLAHLNRVSPDYHYRYVNSLKQATTYASELTRNVTYNNTTSTGPVKWSDKKLVGAMNNGTRESRKQTELLAMIAKGMQRGTNIRYKA